MRLSQLFGKTQREIPSEADTISHQYLLRTGMINQLASGVYSYLPLAWRVLKKIENIIRDEMGKAGGQELMMPVLQPLELWQESGRNEAFGEGLFTLRDRRNRNLALGPTHEEVITKLVGQNVQSYRDLPLMLYQIQTKFRDEPRPRGGLLRVREFSMKDLYSFDVDEAGLDISYEKMMLAYQSIFQRCGLPAVLVEADSGAIGGKDSHEYMLIADNGEDEIIYCENCKYTANAEKAASFKGAIKDDEPLPLKEVHTPGMTSIEQVSGFLFTPADHILKAVLYDADGELVMAVIRGDLDVNDIKLNNVLHATNLRLATEEEAKAAGIVTGFFSPVGLNKIKTVADDSVAEGINFVAGANKQGFHITNVYYPRDFKVDITADIASARAGDSCPSCQNEFKSTRGIEVGHIFKLGTFLSNKLGASYIDAEGASHPIVMGCYGIGIGRLLAAAIEQNHDDKGIIWPMPIAPYQIYLCPLYRDNTAVEDKAEELYAELEAVGLEVLFDDRKESPGVKFNDADLLGIPFRITISPRTLEKNSVEVKMRSEKESKLLPLEWLADKLKEMVEGQM